MEIGIYRKKPVIVRAYVTEIKQVIHTLEGDMTADPGDYIIMGVKGEMYPCKPDVFHETYESVEDAARVSNVKDSLSWGDPIR